MTHTYKSASPMSQPYSSPSARSSTPASAGEQTPNSSTGSLANSANSKPKPKPVNVFSNDGFFLERFQRNKLEEEEKEKVKNKLERKINFENRFKNRGKRKSSPHEDEDDQPYKKTPLSGTSNSGSGTSNAQTPEEPPSKRQKVEDHAGDYQKEMRNFESATGGLSSTGTGSRPLVK